MSDRSLPDDWLWVRFGDVVQQVKDKVDPQTAGLTRYIAGEHMDTDDLRLRRWGDVDDGYLGPAFHMRFKPGQVLYGSRRTYLRKVAVADFEGICANTTFVLEPSSDDLLPEFLPQVMSTQRFHEHSVQQSKGSVNPYINFRDLTWFEFALPPEQVQRRIASTLLLAGEASSAYSVSAEAAETLWMAALEEMPRKVDVREVPLEDLCREPITYGIVQAGPEAAGGVPYIRVSDMTSSESLEAELLPRTSEVIAEKYKRSACESGDLVFALRGPIGLTRRVPDDLAGVNLTQGTARLAPDSNLTSADFLEWSLKSAHVQRQYRQLQKGSTFKEMSLSALRRVTVQLPWDLDQQHVLSRHLDAIAEVVWSASQAATDLANAASSLRERLIRGAFDV